MNNQADMEKSQPSQIEAGITQITVAGYKSINQEQSIEIRPLTILAGANSSGKSSMMQPLLLLKQTLEASYDPGALLLNGPHVKFTSVDQLLSCIGKRKYVDTFHVGIRIGVNTSLIIYFKKYLNKGFEVQQMSYTINKEERVFRVGMTQGEVAEIFPLPLRSTLEAISELRKVKFKWFVVRNRCFLELAIRAEELAIKVEVAKGSQFDMDISPSQVIEPYISETIHLPGLRGNPERTYPVAAVGPTFPGTFETYTASVIAQWQTEKNDEKLENLSNDLERLGLTWKVIAKSINDAQVELQVGRLMHPTRGEKHDLINIADVGFGLSQTLPVLVALHVAKPGQLVYLEQPELHLHPRAQSAMAEVLADAANRGVRVVAETHSSLLLLGIQTLVAEGKVSPEIIKLH